MARVVADYFILHQKSFHGFDTNVNDPRLVHRFPQHFTKIDITQVKDQMDMLDSILDQAAHIALIDVWSPIVPHLFTLLSDTQFIFEAEQRGFDVVFMLGISDIASAQTAARAIHKIANHAKLVGVINEGVVSFGYEPSELLDELSLDQTFEMGALDHITLRTIDAGQFSLSRFLMTPPSAMSIVLRAQLKQWLTRMFTQLQSFELRRSLMQNDFLR